MNRRGFLTGLLASVAVPTLAPSGLYTLTTGNVLDGGARSSVWLVTWGKATTAGFDGFSPLPGIELQAKTKHGWRKVA
jgi:hypothetical protein